MVGYIILPIFQTEYLFLSLFAIFISSFMDCQFRIASYFFPLAHLSFLCLSLKWFDYSDINSCVCSYLQCTFFLLVVYYFLLFLASFDKQWQKLTYWTFFPYALDFSVHSLKRPSLSWVHKIIFIYFLYQAKFDFPL